ncbi:hypothetical protein A3K79_04060 [Candidatus Bathyarchaeota archaeon RBG_13_46_16b]|nr:MAG: hypothetical protein A3K79_04060 [Candidatus Bathyarchaeota archaeon RBG_13_46_16b]
MTEMHENFALKVKMGEYEVELSGTREEVLKTIEDLPTLVASIHKAFENVKPKTVTTLTVKTEPPKEQTKIQKYPKISPTQDCEEAITRILHTDWGKWRPRMIEELKEALQANGLNYPIRVLARALSGLVKKGKVKRWNTDAGFVYILVENEALGQGGRLNEEG